jgi:hypothetical protein
VTINVAKEAEVTFLEILKEDGSSWLRRARCKMLIYWTPQH